VLSAGNFVIGLGAFVVIGLVSPIATAYGASLDEAGHVMTWYAAAYAVGSPLVTALTGRAPRRAVLAGGLVVFGLGIALGALAPSLLTLDLSRVVVAAGAGLYTPGAAAVTVATAPPEHRATQLSMVFAGLTLAQVIGVPLGTYAGYAYGFQMTFWAVAALALLAAALVYAALPADLPFQPASLKVLGETLAAPSLIGAVLFTTSFVAAIYGVYTYLGPLIEARYGYGRDGVALFLLLFGLAAVFGNFVGGALADRIGPSATLALIGTVQLVMLPTVTIAPLAPLAMAGCVVVWSLAGWSFMTPQQARLVAIAPDRAPVMLALNASALYLGVAVGSAVGGFALRSGGWTAVGATAGLVAALALLHLRVTDRAVRRSAQV
jgi:DHA1 family inner membrane transport protein